MAGPLLETKLYVPTRRRQLVSRARLLGRLDGTTESRLTLVSAPPGFGKTTLLSDWVAARGPDRASIAWLSLDEGDNQSEVFWAYVVAALRNVAPEVGADASALLGSSQSPSIEAALTLLINALRAKTEGIVLVLDDYHVISRPEIHEAVAFLVDHLPPTLHLVIATRADPPLPLARMRARGELVELRAADLRFLPEEVAAFFNEVMDLDLRAAELDALEARTEGWIAALQLAAISMQGRADVVAFIDNFAGDDHYIVDYLVEEVLQRQPEAVRHFLLRTAILDRLCGPLCDAITGQRDSEATLRLLEHRNIFVVPLDDRRVWYRYHHLFADALRAHLAGEGVEVVRALHGSASLWFEQNGERSSAIRHALAAGAFERAAALVELALPEMLRGRQDVALRSWFEALPEELLRLRPVLSAGFVGLLLQSGEVGPVEALLQDAERSLGAAAHVNVHDPLPSGSQVFVDEAQFRELPGMIALYRAGYAQVTGNLDDAAKYARLALERMPDDAPLRGGAFALLGLALWSNGELEAAQKTYSEGIASVHSAGYVNDSSTLMLGDIRVARGLLREALGAYRQSLDLATEQGRTAPRGTADQHVGISEIYREQDELDAAVEHLSTSRALGEAAGLPENRYRWFTAMAAISRTRGDLDTALELLREAERLYAPGFSPDVRPIAALRARIWLLQGRLDDVDEWARERGLTAGDELSYLREYDHLTLARLILARSKADSTRRASAALQLLGRLAEAAAADGRKGALIESLVLRALAHQVGGDTASSVVALEHALTLAEPEGYVRIFLDEGRSIEELLELASQRERAGYARRLLASIHKTERIAGETQSPQDSLSERELEVMRLLGTDLSGPDIARELVVSLNTVRTHTKSIYTKLSVNSRRAAVRRAQDLHLL